MQLCSALCSAMQTNNINDTCVRAVIRNVFIYVKSVKLLLLLLGFLQQLFYHACSMMCDQSLLQ